jgi:hypothetical protein
VNNRKKTAGLVFMTLLMMLPASAFCQDTVDINGFYGDESGSRTVLILADTSNYKNAVAVFLADMLADSGDTGVTVDSIRNWKDHDPADYSAVVIIGTGKARRHSGPVRKFLERNGTAGNILVMSTWGNPETSGTADIDTVTSASNMELSTEAAETLYYAVQALTGR